MVVKITWSDIHHYWHNYLWTDRTSPIEQVSAMQYLGGYAGENMEQTPVFFGYLVDTNIVGVNSGHPCVGGGYRSRGLWVDPAWRRRGIGKELLLATVNQAREEGARYVWSYPRKTSWSTYSGAGFLLTSGWSASETSEANAYCWFKL